MIRFSLALKTFLDVDWRDYYKRSVYTSNSCSYYRIWGMHFLMNFVSFIKLPRNMSWDVKYNCLANSCSLKWFRSCLTTRMATTFYSLQIMPEKYQFIQFTMVIVNWFAGSRISPFLIEVYCNQNLNSKFRTDTILSYNIILIFCNMFMVFMIN